MSGCYYSRLPIKVPCGFGLHFSDLGSDPGVLNPFAVGLSLFSTALKTLTRILQEKIIIYLIHYQKKDLIDWNIIETLLTKLFGAGAVGIVGSSAILL